MTTIKDTIARQAAQVVHKLNLPPAPEGYRWWITHREKARTERTLTIEWTAQLEPLEPTLPSLEPLRLAGEGLLDGGVSTQTDKVRSDPKP